MEVDGRRGGGVEGGYLPDHGEDDGFGGGGVGDEGDVEDGGGVDDGVDEVGVVFCCKDDGRSIGLKFGLEVRERWHLANEVST